MLPFVTQAQELLVSGFMGWKQEEATAGRRDKARTLNPRTEAAIQ